MSTMRNPETIAKWIVENTLPDSTMDFNPCQSNGECDFTLRLPGREKIPLEVTEATDHRIRSTYAEIRNTRKGGYFITAVKCTKSWLVHPTVGAKIDHIRSHADEYLAKIEETGIDNFFVYADGGNNQQVLEIYKRLGIEAGNVVPWKHGTQIGIGFPSGGGLVSAQCIQKVVEKEAQKADNRRKLGACNGNKSHLFIYVDPLNYLPWAAMLDTMPPAKAPDLPPEISHVWAVASTRTIDEYVVWRAERGIGWTQPFLILNPAPVKRDHGPKA